MVEDEIDALDCVDDVIEMLGGAYEALSIKGCGRPDGDLLSKMLAKVVLKQLDSLQQIKSWLEFQVARRRQEFLSKR